MNYEVYAEDPSTYLPVTGLTLSWVSLKNAAGANYTPQPTFSELGAGWYRFSVSPAEILFGRIDLSASMPTQARYIAVKLDPSDSYVDAAVSSRSTYAGTDTPGTTTLLARATEARLAELDAANLPTDVAAVKSDTGAILTESQSHPTLAEIEASAVLAKEATLNFVIGYIDTEVAAILAAVDTEVAAIKAKTDNLPVDPATASSQTTIIGYIDTEITALQASVDGKPTLAQMIDGGIATVNDVKAIADTTSHDPVVHADTKAVAGDVIGVFSAADLAKIAVHDSDYLNVGEAATTPGVDCQFRFEPGTGVKLNTVHIHGYYQGNPAHYIDVYAWNYDASAWELLHITQEGLTHRTSESLYEFALHQAHLDSVNGCVLIRFLHPSAGNNAHTGLMLNHLMITSVTSQPQILTGPYKVTLQLYQTATTIPIADVLVDVYDATNTSRMNGSSLVSAANGQLEFYRSNGTYKIRLMKAGVTFALGTVVVAGADVAVTLYGTTLADAVPPVPNMQNLVGNVRRLNWAAATGDKVRATIISKGLLVGGALIQDYKLEATIDVNGNFLLVVPIGAGIRVDVDRHGSHDIPAITSDATRDIANYLT